MSLLVRGNIIDYLSQTEQRDVNIVSVAVVLVLDWRCGSRLLYSHITERETDRLHIENREQRERRLLRENNAGINTLS